MKREFTLPADRMYFLEMAIKEGKQAAADLLLLIGPDSYVQDYDNYQDLMYWLTDGKDGKPLES